MKYLHILEYSKFSNFLPILESFEHEFTINNSIFRTSIVESDSKEKIKESFNPIYNNQKLDEEIIPLTDVVIYDNIDVIPEQKLAYVYQCPVCLNVTISSDNKTMEYCPQCENSTFDFDLIAIINTEQMEEIAINEKENTSLVLVKDDEVVMVDEKREKLV